MTLLPKPFYGDPCNGCGVCCIAAQCALSTAIFGDQEICPALERAGASLSCGLVRNTADYIPDLPAWGGKALTEAFALMLGAGLGCDGELTDEDSQRRPEQLLRMVEKAKAAIETASPEARTLIAYFRSPA